MTDTIKDADQNHWVYRAPQPMQPFLQLARYDRPVGYWLLALPGWIGLAFASLSHGFALTDLKWAGLILIGAIAMRGAGCTYNDIVDRNLDAQVERTALRPIPAGTISLKKAWLWLAVQCFVGSAVLLCLPRLAQIISLCSIPLVAAYPFMKRITWWPQVWLGLTFNWAVLVAYAAKTGTVSPAVIVLYIGLIFWTIGYDTIYACQDIEDDMKIGVKSTARRFGKSLLKGVFVSYFLSLLFVMMAITYQVDKTPTLSTLVASFMIVIPFGAHLLFQAYRLSPENKEQALRFFKSNRTAAIYLVLALSIAGLLLSLLPFYSGP